MAIVRLSVSLLDFICSKFCVLDPIFIPDFEQSNFQKYQSFFLGLLEPIFILESDFSCGIIVNFSPVTERIPSVFMFRRAVSDFSQNITGLRKVSILTSYFYNESHSWVEFGGKYDFITKLLISKCNRTLMSVSWQASVLSICIKKYEFVISDLTLYI